MTKENFNHLNNTMVLTKIIEAVKEEKASTLKVLKYLHEVDSRRLYAELAFSSLFEFCLKHLGYSENEAHCRISAMRLLPRAPMLETYLAQGEITLTAISLLKSHINHEEKRREQKIDNTEIALLANSIIGLPTREAEKVLHQQSSSKYELASYSIKVDSETIELLAKLKELRHQASPGDLIKEIFREEVARVIDGRRIIAEKLEKAEAKNKLKTSTSTSMSTTTAVRATAKIKEKEKSTAEINQNKIRSRYLPNKMKSLVLVRSGFQCEYSHPQSGERCQYRGDDLQIDHIKPFSMGGETAEGNLRAVCRSHNLYFAVKTYGQAKMDPYLKWKGV